MAAVDVVQRQVEAYNDRDLNRFVSTYSETITIFRMPSTEPSISGKVQLAEFYATQRFKLPKLRAQIVNRILLGDKVIDHERVWGIRDTPIEVADIPSRPRIDRTRLVLLAGIGNPEPMG